MKKIQFAVATLAALLSSAALADAVISSMKGDVRIGNDAAINTQRVFTGTTINTGPGAQVILKFDDQQQVVLNENTTFRIADFRYRATEPRSDRAVFDLLRGALRFISGVVGARNPNTVALRVPQATIGIRGTDFMVALVNPAYVNVVNGSIATTNSAGTVVFGPGAIGSIASTSTLATPIPAAALPGAASGAFSNLAAAQVAAAVTPAAAQGVAAGAAAGTVAAPTAGIGAAIAVGVGAAVIGTAVSDEGGGKSTTQH
ncbi:MAG TPA: FecR family protein [Burkholderiales bacterium]|nr:FecR family protein [Burkholderiales bacterium]